jgi:hypothetical protein
MRNGKLDKIKEWVKANRLYLIQAGCVIAIAVIVAAIMIPDMAVTHGRLAATMNRFEQGISHIGSEIADLSNVVQGIDNDLGAAEDKVDALEGTVGGYDGAIAVATAKADAVDAALDDAVEDLQGQITAINATTLEAWLTGNYPDFTVHAMGGKAGNYTSTIYLCYAEPVVLSAGNHTAAMDEFYASIDWDEAEFAYIPALSYDGEDWVVTAISFSIGVFDLEAGVEKTIDVVAGGIHEDFAPDWAYVEIWPVWKE